MTVYLLKDLSRLPQPVEPLRPRFFGVSSFHRLQALNMSHIDFLLPSPEAAFFPPNRPDPHLLDYLISPPSATANETGPSIFAGVKIHYGALAGVKHRAQGPIASLES